MACSTKGVTDLHTERGDLNLEVVEELDTAKQFFLNCLYSILLSLSLGGGSVLFCFIVQDVLFCF